MADYLRRRLRLELHEIFERHHHAFVGADVIFLDVAGFGAELFVGLDVDAIGAIVEIEIVHVDGAHVDLQGVGDLIQRDAEGFGAFAVEIQDELWIVGAETCE